ncbi:MAG: DUF1788 domain-containing protein [Chloroflexi bacterium]|nr:DUF1788 domain-containing protein [Chloroflexota bacterium]
MTDNFEDRLNQILPRITSDDFLKGQGLGNEIAFFIFDYPSEEELRVRQHIDFLMEHDIPRQQPGLSVKHINLFDFVIEHLKDRNLLDRAIELQKTRGDEFLLRHLEKILHPNKLAPLFAERVQPEETDLVLASGVGSVWPLMRTHTLLNNLHSVMEQTPLVMFYPGSYDGRALSLFGKIRSDNYYRAFQLIP